jgi:hypothetical protein
MKNLTPGQYLEQQRRAKDLSQRDLARLTGISQARLSRLERDYRTAKAEEWAQLREHLVLPANPPNKQHLPSPSAIWRVAAPSHSSAGKVPFSTRKYRARESFRGHWNQQMLLLQRRSDGDLILRFLNDAGLDSAVETKLWVDGIVGGGRPRWYALLKAGFRKFPVLDRTPQRKAAGDVRHPCLEILRDDYAVLMFPQVRVVTRKGVYTMDCLACIRRKGFRRWVNIEVDGAGHNGEHDSERAFRLELATIRLTTGDLSKPDMLARLEQRLIALLDEKDSRQAPRRA